MIDHNLLKVGTKFYRIKEDNHGFHRNKIRQVIDGVEWFRYDKPVFTYEIIECEVMGILKKTLEGMWDPHNEYDMNTEYFIRQNANFGYTYEIYNQYDFEETENIFLDKKEALLYKETMELKAKEIDRK